MASSTFRYDFIIRPHRYSAYCCQCSVVCVSVSVCWTHWWTLQKRLNQSRGHLKCGLMRDWGPKEPCIRWGPRLPYGKGHLGDNGHTWACSGLPAVDILNIPAIVIAPAIRHLMTDIRRVKRCIIIIMIPRYLTLSARGGSDAVFCCHYCRSFLFVFWYHDFASAAAAASYLLLTRNDMLCLHVIVVIDCSSVMLDVVYIFLCNMFSFRHQRLQIL